MAQHAVLANSAAAHASYAPSRTSRDWSARTKFLCIVGCSLASWGLVLLPFYLIG